MTEEIFRKFSVDELVSIMLQFTKQLVDIINEDKENKEEYEAKSKEIQLIQKIIADKRNETQEFLNQ